MNKPSEVQGAQKTWKAWKAWKPLAAQAGSLVLGGFFVVSGAGKIMDVEAFARLLSAYGLGGWSWIAPFVPPVEVLLGLALALGIRNRLSALCALALLLVFTVGFANAYWNHGVQDCGCFGAIAALKSSPAVSFARNALLMLLAAFVWRASPDESTTLTRWQRASMLVLGAVLFTASGVSYHKPLVSTPPFIGEKISSTPLHSLLAEFQRAAFQHTAFQDDEKKMDSLRTAPYLVFVFGADCSYCWNMTENVKAFAESNAVSAVYGLASGDSASLKAYQTRFEPTFPIALVPEERLLAMVSRLPTAFIVRNGVVERVFEVEIPSPHVFLRQQQKR